MFYATSAQVRKGARHGTRGLFEFTGQATPIPTPPIGPRGDRHRASCASMRSADVRCGAFGPRKGTLHRKFAIGTPCAHASFQSVASGS